MGVPPGGCPAYGKSATVEVRAESPLQAKLTRKWPRECEGRCGQGPGRGELGQRGRTKVNPPLFRGRSLAEGGVRRWKESTHRTGGPECRAVARPGNLGLSSVEGGSTEALNGRKTQAQMSVRLIMWQFFCV